MPRLLSNVDTNPQELEMVQGKKQGFSRADSGGDEV